MPAPRYTDADYLAGLLDLLPTGAIWPRDPDSVQVQSLAPLVKTYTRNGGRAADLLTDARPVAPVELLPEWQRSLGLPDPCAGVSPSLETEQQQVAARFVASGGQSIAYYVGVAAALGYPISITMFRPFGAGMAVGQPLYGTDWAHAWQVNAPTFNVASFSAGHSAAGDPLASWGNTVLQCELQRLAPAHTVLLFNYD